MFNNRVDYGEVGFRDSGYDISIAWQTLIVTGVADSAGSAVGTSTFYVNGVQVGTADRVGSGTDTATIGQRSNQNPGYISVAGVLNQKLTASEIGYLHTALISPVEMNPAGVCAANTYGDGSTCLSCGVGRTSAAGSTNVDSCRHCAGNYITADAGLTCIPCSVGTAAAGLETSCVAPNLVLNLDGASTDSLANDGTSWTSVSPGSSAASGTAGGDTSYFSTNGIRGFSFDGSADTITFAAGTGGITREMTLETCGTGYSTQASGTSGADASACDVCAPGFSGTSANGTSGCTACPQGTYGSATSGNGNSCSSCGSGYSTSASATTSTASSTLIQVAVSVCVSWSEANQLAVDNNGRLPTKAELIANNINLGNVDIWMPISRNSVENDWVQVGTKHVVSIYTYHQECCDPPDWGLHNGHGVYRPCSSASNANYIFVTPFENSCTVCAAGYEGTSVSGTSGCTPCPQGTYGSLTPGNGNSCNTCTTGKFQDSAGASTCTDCAVGTTTSSSTSAADHDSSADCNVCAVGYSWVTAQSSIIEKGSYGDDGSNMNSRAMRVLKGLSGYTKATCSSACSAYTYFALQNGSECWCENDWGRASKYGSKSCGQTGGHTCNYIWEHVSSAAGCLSCAAGYSGSSVGGTSGCTPCPQGSYGSATAGNGNTCTACNAGYTTTTVGVTGTDASACTVCAAGYEGASISGTSGCTACPRGTYGSATAGNGNTCTACNAGYTTTTVGVTGTDASACTVCAAGYEGASISGTSGCTACPRGTYGSATAGNGNTCTACNAGYTTTTVGVTGTDASACTVCAVGYEGASISGTGGCTACPQGTYGSLECGCERPAGTVVAGAFWTLGNPGDSCDTACGELVCNQQAMRDLVNTGITDANAASSYAGITCTYSRNSGGGASVPLVPSSSSDCRMYRDNNEASITTCAAIPASTQRRICACSTDNREDCTITCTSECRLRCDAGMHLVAGVCTACPAGKYRPVLGMNGCINCGAGKSSDAIGAAKSSTCEPCGAGEFSSPGYASCSPCAAGFYAKFKSAACVQCPAGRYVTAIQDTCEVCDAGTFSAAGAAGCINCAAGYFSHSMSSQCTICNAGSYSHVGSSECILCPKNTYSNPGASACKSCHKGYFSRQGAAACGSCVP